MLRYEPGSIDDLRLHVVAKVIENLLDYAERVAPVVALQVLDVLKQEGGWTLSVKDSRNVEEECPLSLVSKSMGPPKCVLLRDSGN